MNKKRFVEFLFNNRVILMGNFMTKSKRQTPYFFNFGQLYTSDALSRLGYFYAKGIKESVAEGSFPRPTVIFGPAYKGIPLSVSTVLCMKSQGDIAYAFNRKEMKTHGDCGVLVGKPPDPRDQVVLVDDVITSGISIRKSINLLRNRFRTKVIGVMVAIDREEPVEKSFVKKTQEMVSASTYISKHYHLPVKSLITLTEFFTIARKYRLISETEFKKVFDYIKKTTYEKNKS